ncbi:putative EXOIII [Lyophyllum shimeji]|uniref:EXOIII n=1 Tax=Lyophyllum shimeji TaxID=47721 RepID=A0A9P3Q0Q7_LYOSH|nr:putative EXOIII [Lyophyllum shimeji]
MAMKRLQIFSPTSDDTPKNKKTKTNGMELTTTVESAVTETEGWTKVEKRKQKKVTKKEIKLDATQPRFMYNNAEIIKRNHAIGIDEIRNLVVHILADAPPPNWLRIDNADLIQKVVTLLIPGLTPELLSLPPIPTSATVNPNVPLSIPLLPRTPDAGPPPSVPFIAATFSHACPTRAPGDLYRMHSVLSAFFQGPVSGEERNKRATKRLLSENVKNRDPAQYLLTLEQMIENEYPIPSYMADVFEKPPGWVETPEPPKQGLLDDPSVTGKSAPKQKIYSIDCEMCLTEDGKELARVCMIDFHTEKVVYDQLVRPPKPIVDYLTRWSGITAEALAPVTTTLAQAQAQIMRLLSPLPPPANPFSPATTSTTSPPPTPILIGHSLESDLKALKICHPLCIDTALLYHHPRGRPLKPGLAWLTKKWCGREIQTRGEGGHDPEEDARACLELLKLKIENGPAFGEFKTDMESIFERMARSTRRAGGGAGGTGSIRSAVVDHGNPAVMHGSKATTAVGCASDAEVLEGLLEVIPSHHFAFGRLTALADVFGWTTPKTAPDAPPPPPAAPPTPEVLAPVLDTLNTQLKTLHTALPPRTALVIFTGHSDPMRMAALNARKTAFESAIRSGKTPEELGADVRWTAADARELEAAVELAKRGLLFLGIKQ